jgi:hypothetical protein
MNHKSNMNVGGESHGRVVPAKYPNKDGKPSAEGAEGRRPTKENTEQTTASQTQSWGDAFTDAPEIGVQALAKLHQSRELPAASDAFTELFMTHPTFAHRVGAIVNYGQIPADRLPLVLEEAGMTITAVHNSLEEDQEAS